MSKEELIPKRVIKFRGKTLKGQWVYGDLIQTDDKVFIAPLEGWAGHVGGDGVLELDVTEVVPESVGQFTGMQDKNGTEIFEGDILHCHEYDSSDCVRRIVQTFPDAVVGFSQGSFYYHPKGNMLQPHQLLMYAYQPEVIGNIYQNPSLLKSPDQ